MLRAAADGLDRSPHVTPLGHQIPTGGGELFAADATAVVNTLRMSGDAVADDVFPDEIAVAFDHRMR